MEIATEITERKRLEEELQMANDNLEELVEERSQELRKSEQEYRTIAEFTFDWETWINPEGKYRYVSPSCKRITGYDADEFLKDPGLLFRIAHPEDKDFVRKHFATVSKNTDNRCAKEFRIINRDGSIKWIGHVCQPVTGKDGKFLGRRGSNRDITERKKQEEKLLLYQQKLELHARNTPLGVIEFSRDGIITDWNISAESIFGYKRQEAIGKQWYILAPDESVKDLEGVWDTIISGEGGTRSLNNNATKDGRIISCEWFNTPLINDDGVTIGIASLVLDVTESIQTHRELEEHRNHLEELVEERTRKLDEAVINLKRSNQELENFAYVASHDLQEPLRMVSSYTQLLEKRYKDQLDEDAHDFINYAVDGASRMQVLINDLLDYSRVTTRGKPMVRIGLNDVLGKALATLKYKIQDTGAIIMNDDMPMVYGDEGQLVRVFQNLLDNGIKFMVSETPKIMVSSEIKDDMVQIAIKDNGIGIEEKYKDRIFTIFQRLNNKKDYPGTGIGLAICKRIIERHGGEIWFESKNGDGTTFYFTLKTKK
jgi:PAS domain S-box-containing protein